MESQVWWSIEVNPVKSNIGKERKKYVPMKQRIQERGSPGCGIQLVSRCRAVVKWRMPKWEYLYEAIVWAASFLDLGLVLSYLGTQLSYDRI